MSEVPIAPELEVVICTYNKAPILDRVLSTLACQTPDEDSRWSCLVVDNNCTDDTANVIQSHVLAGSVPGLRIVQERIQGLTSARLRGAKSTTAPWIAFVDDDCLLQPDWIAQALAFAESHPSVGAFGGRVILEWEVEPPRYVLAYAYSFAEQEHGDLQRRVEFLAGAGLVVNRSALSASGWIDSPLLADRVGNNLVSGGDVEIVLRVAGGGHELWYVPSCVLHHFIPKQRTTLRYLTEINRNLGISQALADALVSEPRSSKWFFDPVSKLVKFTTDLVRLVVTVARRQMPLPAVLIQAGFVLGYLQGNLRILAMSASRRAELLGRARPRSQKNPSRSEEEA
jgi:glycosyltransferase involved in cell wall biosynthesis